MTLKTRTNDFDAEYLRSVLTYDPATGDFVWKKRGNASFNSKWAGRKAGSNKIAASGNYVFIRVGSHQYLAHRLAWLYMTGLWPQPYLDHKDCNGLNNAWSNLRASDAVGNARNHRRRKDAKTKFKGVHYSKRQGKYVAQISVLKRKRHLGCFDTEHEAGAAYQRAATESFGEFARF